MPIPDSILNSWSHHHSGKSSKQAHTLIRDALAKYPRWERDDKYEPFLQGSYKNDTNLRGDSDVDLVVQLMVRLRPRVAALTGPELEENESHIHVYEKWKSFRSQVLKALRATLGKDSVNPGRKSLKISKGILQASADVVVTVNCEKGLAFFLPDEHRWVISFPQQHYARGVKKEKSTSNRYKRTIRMFKAARNLLVDKKALKNGTAPSYFIECLLYNVPDGLFHKKLSASYSSIVEYLSTAGLEQFVCQNGVRELFGESKDLWDINRAQQFIQALRRLWEKWPV